MFHQSFGGGPPHNGTHGDKGATVYQSIWNLKRLLNRISSKPCSTDQLELARSLLEPLLAFQELYPDEITSLECRVMNLLVEDDHSFESDSLGDQEDLLLDDDGLGPKGYSPKGVEETPQVAETSPQDMLEAEISEMAHQLKNSSLHMHSTLAQQNKTMDSIAETQQGNLDKVHAATDKVQDHLKRGWKRSFFTWTLFFVILGSFSFLILLIRTVPKRKGACIWFLCSEEDAAYQYYYRQKQQIEKEQEQRHKRDQHLYEQQKTQKKKPTEPKYSYCEFDEENDSNICTSPRPKQVHDSMVSETLESPLYAEEYAMETKLSRLQNNMKIAEESEPASFYEKNEENAYEEDSAESYTSEDEEGDDYYVEEETETEVEIEAAVEEVVEYVDSEEIEGEGEEVVEEKVEYVDSEEMEKEGEEVVEEKVEYVDSEEMEKEGEEVVEEKVEYVEVERDGELEEETVDDPSEVIPQYDDDESQQASELEESQDEDDGITKTCQSHPGSDECTLQKVDATNVSLEDLRKLIHTADGTPQLLEMLVQRPELFEKKDGNGWQIIHEAVYTGKVDLVRNLLELYPESVNSKTGLNGITPLDIALHHFPATHPVIPLLQSFQPIKNENDEASDNLVEKEKEKEETPNIEKSDTVDEESGNVQESQKDSSHEQNTKNDDVDNEKDALVNNEKELNTEQQGHENIATDAITDPNQQLHTAEESMGKVEALSVEDQVINNDTAEKEESSSTNIDDDGSLNKKTHTKQSEKFENIVNDSSSKKEAISNNKMEESIKDKGNSDDRKKPEVRSQTEKKDIGSIPEVVDFTQRDLVLAAHSGQCRKLKSYLQKRPQWAILTDENGWQPIHESARAGHAKCVEILLFFGADINARTGRREPRDGPSVLWWAASTLDKRRHHNFIQFLRDHGAIEIAAGKR